MKERSLTDFGKIDDTGRLRVDQFCATPEFFLLLEVFTLKAIDRGYTVWTDNLPSENAFVVWLSKDRPRV